MQRYTILEPIGSGGVGTVYRALDRLTGTQVALKIVEHLHGVPLCATEPAVLQSLTREFRVLAGLRHPHIIKVLDYGFSAELRPFFTMEFLHQAQTIVQAGRAADFAKRIRLLIELLEALAYLNQRGILHRDLKPANVLVSADGVRVLDFGLASPANSDGEFVGTVAYMPPEMLRDRQYVSQSDLYAVGVMAVEMFTGHLPYRSGDVLAILSQEPDLTGLRDTRLHAVLRQLLDKNPVARFQNARAVISVLAEIGDLEIAAPPQIRECYLQAASFVGREAELTTLTEALDAAKAGNGAAILVGGESGVGKSRLLNELRIRALTEGVVVLHGQAVQDSGQPYRLLQTPLAHLAVMNTLTDIEASMLRALLPEYPGVITHNVAPAPLLDADAGQRIAYLMANLIQRLNRPVLLLLEDLQWAEESLSVIQRLSKLVTTRSMIILGSFRSDEATEVPERLAEMSHMPLGRLSYAEVEQLSNAIIGDMGDNPDLLKRLQAESGGNAFFLVETLRMLAEDAGHLGAVTSMSLPDSLLPEGIIQVIQKRLDYVPDWAQPALRLAAVAGRQVDPRLIQQAAAPIDINTWLYTCADAAVLENYENMWRFAHDKLREVLLSLLSESEQAILNRLVAQAIETLHPDDDTQARRLAEHWQAAGDGERALKYALIAGNHLRRVGAYTQLGELAERSLQSIASRSDDYYHMKLLHFLGDAYRYRDTEKSETAYISAVELASRHGWQSEKASSLYGLAVIYRDHGDLQRAEQLIDEMLAYSRQHRNNEVMLPALMFKARVLLLRGTYRQAEKTYHEALAIAEARDDAIQVATMRMNLGAVVCMQGRLDDGEALFVQAQAVAQAVGAVDIVVYCLLNLANIASDRGDFPAAETYFEELIPMIESLGEFSLLAGSYYDLGDLAVRQGKLDEAEVWYKRNRQLAQMLKNYRLMCLAEHGLGKVAFRRNDYLTARRYIEQSQIHAHALNMVPEQITNLNYLTRIHLTLGEQDAAVLTLTEGIHKALEVESSQPMLEILVAALEWLLFTEQLEQAVRLFALIGSHPELPPGHFSELPYYAARLGIKLADTDQPQRMDEGNSDDLPGVIRGLLSILESR